VAKSGSREGKGKAKGRSKVKRPSQRGKTQAAREREAGFIPSPNFAVIAADPLKAKVVAVSLHRLYSPSEFARDEDIALNVASYTFRVLREKGIIELIKEVPVGGTIKHMYRAIESAFIDEADWGRLADALRPIFVGTILQDFSGRTTQAIETGHLFSRDDFCLYWTPRDLDEIAWKEQDEIVKWTIEESERFEVETANRRANGESQGSFHSTFAIAAFPSPTHEEFKRHQAKQSRKKGKAKAGQSKGKAKPKGQAKGSAAACKGKGNGRKARKGKGRNKGKGGGKR
jgi:hypothetical protein